MWIIEALVGGTVWAQEGLMGQWSVIGCGDNVSRVASLRDTWAVSGLDIG